MAEQPEPMTYVSPDGSEMPVRSMEARINLESRGWTPKSGPMAGTSPEPLGAAAKDPKPKQTGHKPAADE